MAFSSLEPIYEIISSVSIVLLRAVTAFFLVRLYISFAKNEDAKRKLFIAGAVYFAIDIFFFFIDILKIRGIVHVFAFLIAYLIYVIVDRENMLLKIYITVTYFVITWVVLFISVNTSCAVINLIGGYVAEYITMHPEKYTMQQINKWFIFQYSIQMLLDLALFSVIVYFLTKRLTLIYENKSKELTIKELVLLLIPSLVGVASFCLDTVYSYNYEEAHQYIFFGVKSAGILWNLYFIILLAAILTTVSFYQQILEKQEYEAKARMLENSVKDIQMHISEVESFYSQLRGVRHDINNHVGVLAGLIEQGNAAEAMEYIKSFHDIAGMSDIKVRTGNPVTDVVINEKLQEAEKNGIEFKSDFHYPNDSDINAFDISIVLTNALSNAVEAVLCMDRDHSASDDKALNVHANEIDGKERFISVSSFRNKNAYLITVTNSFYGKLELNNETGLPISTKNDGKAHGIGLQNVKMVAEKYFGDAKLEVKDNTAVLTVMLKIRS